jgi:hypothetical protein
MTSITKLQDWTWQQKLHGYFALARVSNSPTVVSNVLAGTALAGALDSQHIVSIVMIAVAMVMFYTAGMYLNDLCDYEYDRAKRPDRPLVSGVISRASAMLVTVGLFLLGSLLLLSLGMLPFLAGCVLIALIILYDTWHKTNPISPVIMGSTRMMVYIVAFLTFSPDVTSALLIAVILLLLYIVGLTFIAKSETGQSFTSYWPVGTLLLPTIYFVPYMVNPLIVMLLLVFVVWVAYSISFIYRQQNRSISGAITRLIAGISLYDALIIASTGAVLYALAAICAFGLTLFLQRYVKGT